MAALRCVVAAILLAFFELSYGKVCENPEVVPKVYTTTDGLVLANIAFIAQFHIKCKENVQNVPLYADVKGKIVPVVKSVESNDYQVSWTEELNKAHSGDYLIRVYDEEGYGALRKAQRSGEGAQGVTPLFTINVHHPVAHRFLPTPPQVWQVLTEAVWGTSTEVVWHWNGVGEGTGTSQGPGAGPADGPSTGPPGNRESALLRALSSVFELIRAEL